jgi:hypothetical protein
MYHINNYSHMIYSSFSRPSRVFWSSSATDSDGTTMSYEFKIPTTMVQAMIFVRRHHFINSENNDPYNHYSIKSEHNQQLSLQKLIWVKPWMVISLQKLKILVLLNVICFQNILMYWNLQFEIFRIFNNLSFSIFQINWKKIK